MASRNDWGGGDSRWGVVAPPPAPAYPPSARRQPQPIKPSGVPPAPQGAYHQPSSQPQQQPQQQQQQQQYNNDQAYWDEYNRRQEQWNAWYKANPGAPVPAYAPQPTQPTQPVPAPAPIPPQQPARANGQEEIPEDLKPLYKAVKFFVAAQLSKFLSLPKYFDNNEKELVKSCKHLIKMVFDVERKKDPEGFKTRRMQQGVLCYVNAYMEAYAQRKESKIRDMQAARPGGSERRNKRKRKRYGEIELVGTPHVEDEDYSDDGMDNDLISPEKMTKYARTSAGAGPGSQRVFAPSQGSSSDARHMVESGTQSPKRDVKEFGTQPDDTPGNLTTPSQIPHFAGPEAIYSSQPPTTKSGVKVDHGFDDDAEGSANLEDKYESVPPPDTSTLA